MQSRSIDSYVHALHSMQYMDVQNLDWTKALDALSYGHHVESTYPKFTTLDCEACHFAGTYDVPAQNRSLPSILSASSTLKAGYAVSPNPGYAGMPKRAQFSVPAVITGPAARACGSCHRSEFIKEADIAGMDAFNAHTAQWGYRDTTATAAELSTVIQGLKDAGLLP